MTYLLNSFWLLASFSAYCVIWAIILPTNPRPSPSPSLPVDPLGKHQVADNPDRESHHATSPILSGPSENPLVTSWLAGPWAEFVSSNVKAAVYLCILKMEKGVPISLRPQVLGKDLVF